MERILVVCRFMLCEADDGNWTMERTVSENHHVHDTFLGSVRRFGQSRYIFLTFGVDRLKVVAIPTYPSELNRTVVSR